MRSMQRVPTVLGSGFGIKSKGSPTSGQELLPVLEGPLD